MIPLPDSDRQMFVGKPADDSTVIETQYAKFTWPLNRVQQGVHASRLYHMRSQWTLDGTQESVANLLLDSASLPHWWPQFLESEIVEAGGDFAENRLVRVVTKGWLPYRLKFQFRILEVRYPHWFRLQSVGDFVGTGMGHLQQHGDTTVVNFDWEIRVDKPLLFWASVLLKPLFIQNHFWLMRRGEKHCQSEIRRRMREKRNA